MLYVNILLIALICVIIIDISGIVEEAEAGLSRWLGTKARIPKPFSCSLCMTHWTALIYILCLGQFSILNYAYILFIAVLTPVIGDVVWHVRDTLGVWLNFLYLTITGKKY